MNICESLTVVAKLFPDATAITHLGIAYRYAELNSRSAAAAQTLRKIGIERGDRVAIMLPNVPAFAIWYYAVLRMGAIAVSISPRLASTEVAFIIEDSGAKALTTLETLLPPLAEGLPGAMQLLSTTPEGDAVEIHREGQDSLLQAADATWIDADPEEAAVILYTSGTTGFPKGATLSHRNVRSNVCAFNHLCGMEPEDRLLLAVPLFHCFGQNALLNSGLNVGAHLVLQNGFDLNESKRLIREHQVTQLYGVPMMFQLLLDHCDPADLTSVRYCFSAAATLPVQVSQQWQDKFGMPINEGYGLTETSPFASYNHRIHFVTGSIGTPIDGVEMRVVDLESGQPCSTGDLGEIAIRGPNVMLGYWNRPEDNQAAIRNGWFHSGDIGRTDEQGYFYIVDRVKDMIAVGGLKVYPAEVERTLLDHPRVAEAAVVGAPDAVFGERVVAFLVTKGEPDAGDHDEPEADESAAQDESAAVAASVMQFAKQRLGGYKVPQRLLVVDALPRNPSGKILKTLLREQAEETQSTENADGVLHSLEAKAAPPPVLVKRVRATHVSDRQRTVASFIQSLVQEIGELDELPAADAALLELGLDSLTVVALSDRLQSELGADTALSATLVFDHPRINDLSKHILSLMDEAAPSDAIRGDQGPALAHPPPGTRPAAIPAIPAARPAARGSATDAGELRSEIEQLTEEEALEALLKELDR